MAEGDQGLGSKIDIGRGRRGGAPQRHCLIGHAWTEICLWLKPLEIQIPEMTDD